MGEGEFTSDFDALAICAVRVDIDGRVIAANAAAEAFYGVPGGVVGTLLASVIHPDDIERVFLQSAAGLEGGRYSLDMRAVLADGAVHHVRAFGRGVPVGESIEFVVAFYSIEDQLLAAREHERFQAALDNSADVVVFTAPDGAITYANHAAQSFLAGSAELVDLFDADSTARLIDECLPQTYADGFWAGELALTLGDGYTVPVNAVLLSHSDEHGEIEYLSLVAHDIAILKEAQRALELAATHDGLTGLPNRAHFMDLLRASLARLDRSGGSVAVMFSDLDGFKAVNDGLGHEAGDELLIEVGRRMQTCVRDTDVVARFGGDEFVMLLDGIDDLTVAQRVADRVMWAVERPVQLSSGDGNVGASIGIAIASSSSVDAEALLADADAAMYRAKQLGKRRHQLFDDDLRARAAARQSLLDDLREAVGRREFAVQYLPVVETRSGSVVSVESGLRWIHRKRGTLGAGEFMALARELGMVLDLNRMLLADVGQRASDWASTSVDGIVTTTWVTIGPQEVLQGELDRFLTGLADEHRLPPGAIGIEVPLSVLTRHAIEAERLCQALSWMGVRIAIDDFGADPFIPAQLQRFHVDTVKLDRRFVRSLSDAPEAISALSGIVAFARALGLDVVAKGVERIEEVEVLQELGCTLLQGTVVARPMPPSRLTPLLQTSGPWMARWPTRDAISGPLSRPQVVERLLRLRKNASAA